MNKRIGKRIKDVREKSGKTQQDLAKLLGKTAASISDIERAKVQISAAELYSIAEYLQMPIRYFLDKKLPDFKKEKASFLLDFIEQEEILKLLDFLTKTQDMSDFVETLQKGKKPNSKLDLEEVQSFRDVLDPYYFALKDRFEETEAMKNQIDTALEKFEQQFNKALDKD